MSKWTHLAGLVRIDYIGHLVNRFQPFGEKYIIDVFKEGRPMGSEIGALLHVNHWKQCDIYELKRDAVDENCEGAAYWGDLSISADLRDFGEEKSDIDSVVEWFKKACVELCELYKGAFIRQAILQIEVEYGNTFVVSYVGNKWQIAEIPENWE